jgi:lincosamide nucleotidyltransferase A/C/D/E
MAWRCEHAGKLTEYDCPRLGARLVFVALRVRDLAAAVRFYREAVGIPLREAGGADEERHHEYSWSEGRYLHFALFPAARAGGTPPVELGFYVDDLRLAHQHAVSAGADLVAAPHDQSWGRTASYRDPDGNVVGITQRSEGPRRLRLTGAEPAAQRPETGTRIRPADVSEILDALEAAGVSGWVDGGWGVDALLGEETRPHTDLDLAINREQLGSARAVLESLGFEDDPASEPGLPARLVLRDRRGRQVDLHPLVFDEAGNGWQQLSRTGRAWGRYPAEHLQATGSIAGRRVRCLSAELQFRFRLTHEWSAGDEHDLRLLIERFDVGPVPPPFWPQG